MNLQEALALGCPDPADLSAGDVRDWPGRPTKRGDWSQLWDQWVAVRSQVEEAEGDRLQAEWAELGRLRHELAVWGAGQTALTAWKHAAALGPRDPRPQALVAFIKAVHAVEGETARIVADLDLVSSLPVKAARDAEVEALEAVWFATPEGQADLRERGVAFGANQATGDRARWLWDR
ncbi:MAG: hypothetical protein EBU84_05635 [Actinobacteria bacterium]|nr:hypothetical protein [Actinomycetota bacterium]